MILVRFVFQAPPGRAGEMAKQLSESIGLFQKLWGSKIPIRVLTDLSGAFDTVVQEVTVDSLATWEKIRAAMFSNPEFAEAMEGSAAVPYASGRTEFYTIEAEG